MQYFSALPDGYGLFRRKGRYKQLALYYRGNALYAKDGNSFVRVRGNQATSVPDLHWNELDPGTEAAIEYQGMREPLVVMSSVESARIAAE